MPLTTRPWNGPGARKLSRAPGPGQVATAPKRKQLMVVRSEARPLAGAQAAAAQGGHPGPLAGALAAAAAQGGHPGPLAGALAAAAQGRGHPGPLAVTGPGCSAKTVRHIEGPPDIM